MKNIWKFLGLTEDRIGRRRFLVAFFSAQWGLPLAVLLVAGLFYLVFGDDSPILFLPAIVLIASLIFGLVVYIKICIRRVRDIGIARSWWVLAIIPLVNFPFFIYLCLKKGTTRQLTDGSKTNLFTQQFKLFFAKKYSKLFIFICFGVIVVGIVSAWFAASNLKSNIDTKIQEREEELAQEIFGKSFEQARIEYDKRKSDYEKCLAERTEPTEYARKSKCLIFWETYAEKEKQAYKDSKYQELLRAKEISTFQIFKEGFDRFNFGWLGITIGIMTLVLAFLINILIVLFKFSAKYVPPIFRIGNVQAKSIKTNMEGMPAFQRYLLLIALLMLITLVLVLIKL